MTAPDWGTDVLAGTVVVDLSSGVAGGFCGAVLANAGASVTIVEDPQGNSLRRWTSTGEHVPHDEDGPLFRYLGQSKRSVIVRPYSPADRQMLRNLLRAADVILWSPGSAVAFRKKSPYEGSPRSTTPQ
jgi:crotonobetainyl-CoA:carnitine CoA-transferase CaiB-like acyl-CoA transferase